MPLTQRALPTPDGIPDDHLAVRLARGVLLVIALAFILLGTQYHKLDIERGRGFLTWAWGPWCFTAAALCLAVSIRLRRAGLVIASAAATISFWLARIVAVCVAMANGQETDTVTKIGAVLYGLFAFLFLYVFYGIVALVGKRRGYHLAEQAAARAQADGG